jgi:hypothetical protein
VNRPEGWYLEHFPEEWRKISQQVLRIADKELKSGGKRISDLSLVYPSGFQNLESDSKWRIFSSKGAQLALKQCSL